MACFRDYASCIISEVSKTLVKNCDFFIPLHLTLLLGGPRWNIAMFGAEKLEGCGYTTVKKV